MAVTSPRASFRVPSSTPTVSQALTFSRGAGTDVRAPADLSPTLAIQLLSPFEPLWRDRGWFDLSDLGVHNLVEHDGSLTREDNNSPFAQATDVATQATPSKRLIDRYFPPEVERPLTWQNFAAMLRQ